MSSNSMDSHLNFRVSFKDKALIETAAKLKGLKPQTYARQRLLEIAEKDVIEMSQANTLILNEAEWDHFMAIMESPVQINKNLKKAIQTFKKINKKN